MGCSGHSAVAQPMLQGCVGCVGAGPARLPLAALPPDPLPTLRAERPTWAAARRAAPRVPWAAATKSSSVVRKGTPTGERGRSDWVAGLPGAEGRWSISIYLEEF